MSEKLAKAVENVSEDNAKAISKGLFRYAVQLEMLMRVIAKTNHFTDDELETLKNIKTSEHCPYNGTVLCAIINQTSRKNFCFEQKSLDIFRKTW